MKPLSPLVIAAISLASGITSAEIKEIPPEEMTEAYIKDTTVIVRKQKPVEEGSDKTSVIKVSPLEQEFSEGTALQQQNPASSANLPQESLYLTEQRETELLNQQMYAIQGPGADPLKQVRDEALRTALNLQPGEEIDYDNLSFPSSIPSNVIPPIGTDVATSPDHFVISIPNNGNYNTNNYVTPGGEYEINITPDEITFRLNTPQ